MEGEEAAANRCVPMPEQFELVGKVFDGRSALVAVGGVQRGKR